LLSGSIHYDDRRILRLTNIGTGCIEDITRVVNANRRGQCR
jgi:hypothetical protein